MVVIVNRSTQPTNLRTSQFYSTSQLSVQLTNWPKVKIATTYFFNSIQTREIPWHNHILNHPLNHLINQDLNPINQPTNQIIPQPSFQPINQLTSQPNQLQLLIPPINQSKQIY